jgi:hypothetical protein
MAFLKTLIGGLVTTAGNHRCMLPDGEGCPAAIAASSSTTSAPCASGRHHRHCGGTQAEGPTAPGRADACLHRCELDGRRASRGGPADRVGAGRRPGRQSRQGARRAAVRSGCRYAAARHIRRMFQDFGESRARQGLGTSGSAAHVRLAAVRRYLRRYPGGRRGQRRPAGRVRRRRRRQRQAGRGPRRLRRAAAPRPPGRSGAPASWKPSSSFT